MTDIEELFNFAEKFSILYTAKTKENNKTYIYNIGLTDGYLVFDENGKLENHYDSYFDEDDDDESSIL